jgi:hypothetical protein
MLPLGWLTRPWKTEQLPKLHRDNLQVYDLSRASDPIFREAYLGGIVDVYRPSEAFMQGTSSSRNCFQVTERSPLKKCAW